MTNGDVMKDLFNPRDDQIKVYGEFVEIEIQRQGINFTCELKWWNAPYQQIDKNYWKGFNNGIRTEKFRESKRQDLCTETKEQNYMQGYKDGKSDVLNEVKAEIEQIIDKHKAESKESATVAGFHDFYVEDDRTWPPADQEILIQIHIGDNFSNHIAYLEFDDGEDGGWGFYNKDGEFIADVTEIDAWMPIPQYERDKNYIPIQERRSKNLNIDDQGPEEEKDR